MVKAITSLLVALALVVSGFIFEQIYVKKQFREFGEVLQTVYDKIEDETCTKEDVIAVRTWWQKRKEILHIYIPHDDIREIDYWISETVSLAETKLYEDAISKIEVLLEISKHIPDIYGFKAENIL